MNHFQLWTQRQLEHGRTFQLPLPIVQFHRRGERKKERTDRWTERERGWREKNMIDRETEVHTAWNDENKFGKRSISLEVAGNSYRRGFAFS